MKSEKHYCELKDQEKDIIDFMFDLLLNCREDKRKQKLEEMSEEARKLIEEKAQQTKMDLIQIKS